MVPWEAGEQAFGLRQRIDPDLEALEQRREIGHRYICQNCRHRFSAQTASTCPKCGSTKLEKIY